MTFTKEENGIQYQVTCGGGAPQFRCDLIDKNFSSFDAMESAIKAKQLELRKNFSNHDAVMVDRWSKKVEPVTVTSLDGDTHAWIKRANGSRRKEPRTALYENMDTLLRAIETEAALRLEIEEAWSTCPKWEPKP